jgi:hypothetical protein
LSLLQTVDGGTVGLAALALVDHRSVPLETAGLQGSQYLLGSAGSDPRWVDVLHAHGPGAGMATGIEITAQRRDQRAEVQRTAGGGGESAPVSRQHHRRLRRSLGELQGVQTLVGAAPGEQFGMAADLDDAPPFEHRDAAGILDG